MVRSSGATHIGARLCCGEASKYPHGDMSTDVRCHQCQIVLSLVRSDEGHCSTVPIYARSRKAHPVVPYGIAFAAIAPEGERPAPSAAPRLRAEAPSIDICNMANQREK